MVKKYRLWKAHPMEEAEMIPATNINFNWQELEKQEWVKWEDYKALLDKYNTPSHREVERKDREYQYHMEVGL